MDISDYRPAPHVLDRLQQVNFVAVVGPTAAGKTTLIKAAVAADPSLHMYVASVSRPPRPEERNGVDFHFADKTAMEARIVRAEYATIVIGVSGDIYATAPEDYKVGQTMLMAVLADAMPVFRALPFKRFTSIFTVPPSWETWQERLSSHGFSPEQQAKRLAEAKRSLEFALADADTKLIINQDLSTATEDFIAFATGQQMSERLEQDQARARDLVRNLLGKL